MGINLLSYPYTNTTRTYRGITYTDNFDGSITMNGTTPGSVSGFSLKANDDALVLPNGTYIIRGTGSDAVSFRVRYYDVDDNLLGYFETTTTRAFLMDDTDYSIRVDIRIPSRTTVDNLTVYPQIEAGTELSPWTPYRPPTTIDAENAKQIRQTMDVIIQVTPEQGEPIVINNSNLISCTVSLRSDLSIIEPTLPESEINIEAYFDDDISNVLASIPDETPVTYQAGYPGDMSPVRSFYLAEQITWQDNVMSIHAVDAVHKLDRDVCSALRSSSHYPSYVAASALGLVKEYTGLLTLSGTIPFIRGPVNSDVLIVDDGQTVRGLLAQINEYMHQQDDLWYTYVDAGIPKFTATKPSSIWDINEDDCGDVKRNTARKISSLTVQYRNAKRVWTSNAGTATMVKNVGTTLSFNSPYVASVSIGVADNSRDEDLLWKKYNSISSDNFVVPMVPANVGGRSGASVFMLPNINYQYTDSRAYDGLTRMLKDGVAQSDFTAIGNDQGTNYSQLYTQFVPWDCTYDTTDSFWTDNPGTTDIRSQNAAYNVLTYAEIVENPNDVELSIGGTVYNIETNPTTFSGSGTGENVFISEAPWIGVMASNAYGNIYPDGAFNSMLSRSNVTGSFTWKGDPRMQPRDVVTFHRLDGTTEDITIENITITHEKGGTSAELTYRKGIC